jgi:hypothetical protein
MNSSKTGCSEDNLLLQQLQAYLTMTFGGISKGDKLHSKTQSLKVSQIVCQGFSQRIDLHGERV